MAAINRAQISDLDDIMITHRYKSLETKPQSQWECLGGFHIGELNPHQKLCVCLEDIPKWYQNGSWKQTFTYIYQGR